MTSAGMSVLDLAAWSLSPMRALTAERPKSKCCLDRGGGGKDHHLRVADGELLLSPRWHYTRVLAAAGAEAKDA